MIPVIGEILKLTLSVAVDVLVAFVEVGVKILAAVLKVK